MAGAQQHAPMHSTSSSENMPVRRDLLVSDAQPLLAVVQNLVAAAQHAADIRADLHVVLARRLGPQHGVVAQHAAHIEVEDVRCARRSRQSPRRRRSRPHPAHRAASESAPSASPDRASPACRSAPQAPAKKSIVFSVANAYSPSKIFAVNASAATSISSFPARSLNATWLFSSISNLPRASTRSGPGSSS